MFRKAYYIAFSLVLLLVLVLLNLPAQTSARVKLALGGLFLPIFGLAGSTQKLAEQAGNNLVPRQDLLAQNEVLQKENQALRLQLTQCAEAVRENDRLRQLLGWKNQMPWQVKLARVIGRDPANWWRTVHIDLGSRDGIRENFPVLTADGLVGRVGTVGISHSQVVLLGDPNCHVAAIVQQTRESGIVTPGGGSMLDSTVVDLTYLSRNSQAQAGHAVITSGMGSVFPKGIPIGTIVDTRTVDYGLYMEARVKLAVNLNRLEEVWVLFP